MSQRFDELDSLRGLAAISVFVFHALNVFNLWAVIPPLLSLTPVRAAWSGHQSVILFFVLSGFVISLSFFSNSSTIGIYLIRRVCRIWIPFFVALIVAYFLYKLFAEFEIAGVWGDDVNLSQMLIQSLLISSFDHTTINPVVWSLVHEMRISIIFPIIMLVVIKFNWRYSLLIGLIFSVIGTAGHAVFYEDVSARTSFFNTLHYIFCFIVGAVLAKHKSEIIERLNRLGAPMKFALLSMGVLLFSYASAIEGSVVHEHIADLIVTVGSSVLIVSAISLGRISKFLRIGPIHFIGKISYSIYLYHLVVMLTVYSILNGSVSTTVMISISILLTVMVSYYSYKFIELPAMKMARFITSTKTREIVESA